MPRSSFNWTHVPQELIDRLPTDVMRTSAQTLSTGITYAQACREIGVSERAFYQTVLRVKGKLQAMGYDPENGMTMVSPDPQILKGRTAFVRVDPNTGEERVAHYYNKTDTNRAAQLEAILGAIGQACNEFRPLKPADLHKSVVSRDDLLTVIHITDFHLGMRSWSDETGADWDMDIADQVLMHAIADMIELSPASDTAIFAQLGDLMHWDGLLSITPQHKHVLDADTRFPLLVQSAIDLCIKAVEMMLKKFKRVHVLMAEGNHDLASSVWLRAIMAQVFRDNPRVTVEVSPFPFYHYVWGKTFLGWHHGHLQKMESLPMLFASDPKFKADYGACDHTYVFTGHQHQQKVIERGGIVVEQLPTLSSRDAYAARGFLWSNRETKAITYHKQQGEISRVTVRPR